VAAGLGPNSKEHRPKRPPRCGRRNRGADDFIDQKSLRPSAATKKPPIQAISELGIFISGLNSGLLLQF
jgi:hypothetical protein